MSTVRHMVSFIETDNSSKVTHIVVRSYMPIVVMTTVEEVLLKKINGMQRKAAYTFCVIFQVLPAGGKTWVVGPLVNDDLRDPRRYKLVPLDNSNLVQELDIVCILASH